MGLVPLGRGQNPPHPPGQACVWRVQQPAWPAWLCGTSKGTGGLARLCGAPWTAVGWILARVHAYALVSEHPKT